MNGVHGGGGGVMDTAGSSEEDDAMSDAGDSEGAGARSLGAKDQSIPCCLPCACSTASIRPAVSLCAARALRVRQGRGLRGQALGLA